MTRPPRDAHGELVDEALEGLLAGGHDDRVELDGEPRPGNDLRRGPAAGVRLAQAHRVEDGAADPAVGARDLDRGDEEVEANAERAGELDRVRVRGRLGLAAAVEDGDLVGAQLDGGRGRVHRRASAADHADAPAADRVRAIAVQGGLAGHDRLEQGERVDHAVEALAGHAEAPAPPQAEREEDGVVAARAAPSAVGPVAPAAASPAPASPTRVPRRISTPARSTSATSWAVISRACRHGTMPYAASPPAFARASKIVTSMPCACSSAAQARPAGPAPTTATRLPIGAPGDEEGPAGVPVGVHRDALERADRDRPVERHAHAGALAQALDRADAGTGAAERVRGEDGPGAAVEVAGRDRVDEPRHVDAGGARGDAGRVVAEEAAGRFLARRLQAQPGLAFEHCHRSSPGGAGGRRAPPKG